MSLRKQLALFSLLSLVLPWAGYRYVREMETVLRDGLEQSLLERARTVAGALDRQGYTAALDAEPDEGPAGAVVYARILPAAPVIDGSRSDWGLDASLSTQLSESVRYWAGLHGASAYLAVSVRDESVIYQARPGEPPFGDRLVLLLGGEQPLWRVLATAAPGRVRAQATQPPLLAAAGSYDDRIEAAWLATPQGYSIELRLPVGMLGKSLGIAVVDVDSPPGAAGAAAQPGGYAVELVSGWDTATTRAGPLIAQSGAVAAALEQFANGSNRYTVIDNAGWVRAAAGRIDGARGRPAPRSLTVDLLRYLLQTDDPDDTGLESPPGRFVDPQLREAVAGGAVVKWFRGDLDNSARVIASVPLRHDGRSVGALLLEQASDAVLTATNQAVLRLLTTTFLASVIALLGMLGFATWLSLRVSRLARAAGHALGPRGQIDTTLPGRHARDEIGALARSFERLLERLNDYTSYLRTLTSKLSHELRTPLAVVSTSLDNLEHAHGDDNGQYLARLREGARRLDAILGAMSEATRMEQSIRDAAATRFDAAAVVRSCAQAYSDVYARHEILCSGFEEPAWVQGSPDLLAQLLDKLVDNAASFSEPGNRIEISMTRAGDDLVVTVANQGPLLPPQMRDQLFDSLVSVRQAHGDKPHLGLGLYVARLIAEFHGGRIGADNLADASGVAFTVTIPLGGDGPVSRTKSPD
ncbi:MAG: ATP-binding protein [Gammaproteobacteria bacterium]|jgi:dedicated sortase system histidine kinase